MPRIRSDQIDSSIDSANIEDGTIVNADISALAAIDPAKINTRFKEPVTAFVDLPILNNIIGDIRLVKDLNTFWSWDGSVWNRITLSGAAISGWTTYYPTIGNLGTGGVSASNATWRRVGSNLEVRGTFAKDSSAGSGSNGISVSLPSGLVTSASGPQIGAFTTVASPLTMGIPYIISGVVYFRLTSNLLLGSNITANMTVEYSFSIPIDGWSSNINLVSESTEYASNTSSTDADDTTSFTNSPNGSAGIVGTTAITTMRKKRVRFPNGIKSTDGFKFQFLYNGVWLDRDQAAIYGPNLLCIPEMAQTGAASAANAIGIGFCPVGNGTDIDILFGHYAVADYASGTATWTTISQYPWRVKKISGDSQSESATYGIYESGYVPGKGYFTKFVDGTIHCWGTKSQSIACTSGSGSSYCSPEYSIDFPVAFYEAPSVTYSFYNSSGAFWPGASTTLPTTSASYYRGWAYTSVTQTTQVHWDAWGKWNASRQIFSPGTLVGQDTIFASYKRATSQSVTANTTINFDSLVEDAYSCVTTGSSWKFTAPSAGVYTITGSAIANGGDLYLWKNGASDCYLVTLYSTGFYMSFSHTIRLAQNDYIDFRPSSSDTITFANVQISRIAT